MLVVFFTNMFSFHPLQKKQHLYYTTLHMDRMNICDQSVCRAITLSIQIHKC